MARPAVLALQQQVEAEDQVSSAINQLLLDLQTADPLTPDEALVCIALIASPQPPAVVELLCALSPFLVTAELLGHPATQQPLLSGLAHPSPDVQLALLTQLTAVATRTGLAGLAPELVLTAVASLAGAESVHVWQAAARVLLAESAREDPPTSSLLFGEAVGRLLMGEQGPTSSQGMRALELYGQIATSSAAGFERCTEGGQLVLLLQVWQGDDILSKVWCNSTCSQLSLSLYVVLSARGTGADWRDVYLSALR